VSGPLLDRIDLHIEVTPVEHKRLTAHEKAEASQAVRERVERARAIQQQRFAGHPEVYNNAMMPPAMLREMCPLGHPEQELLRNAMEKLNLSARAYDRILKVSRTIADLGGSGRITSEHLAEAIYYRNLDRAGWAG
jgi:magnesium chelatase family protein